MTNRSDIARELYKEGVPCTEISRTLGMSRQGVYYALKHDSRSKPKPKVHKATIPKDPLSKSSPMDAWQQH